MLGLKMAAISGVWRRMEGKPIKFKNFDQYLDAIGADKIETKSCWEIARFRANNEVCVVYEGKRGASFSNPLAEKIYKSFLEKKLINIQSEKRQSLGAKFKLKIYERDGNKCFYSGKEMAIDEATIEHLIPLSRGGKNNIDNLVLCLREENLKMADRPLIEKIKYKIDNLESKNAI